jgi:uncharacterized protein YfbU (UPF0304 family)
MAAPTKSKLTPQELSLLNEILEMFKSFDAARKRLAGDSIDWTFLNFLGFDAADPVESKYSLHGGYRDSQRKMLPHYIRLLAAWRGCRDNKNLTRAEVLGIIQSARPTR